MRHIQAPASPAASESGTLLLRKPGRMRWDYTSPEGKLFVSDGKYLWLYTPSNHQVEKMKIKESDDMRAPLAFLLGKLHFDKEFRNVHSVPAAGGMHITADPKTDTLPYTKVEFVVGQDDQIRRVQVTGYDQSVLDIRFRAGKAKSADRSQAVPVPNAARRGPRGDHPVTETAR